jgi:hypothetical protein
MMGIFGEHDKETEQHLPTMIYDPETENDWGC